MALVAYLTRGKGNKTSILKEIRESPRLGPKVARWVETHEAKLVNHPGLQPKQGSAVASRAANANPAQSPSQLAGRNARAEQSSAAAPPSAAKKPASDIKNATTAEKGVFGEAKADQHMIDRGFEKMNGSPVKIGDAPKGKGIDGVWRNKNDPPPPEYVISEAKYGSSRLSTLKDGTKQMSDEWVNKRLDKAVGGSNAAKIREADAFGNVEKYLLQVDDAGNVALSTLR